MLSKRHVSIWSVFGIGPSCSYCLRPTYTILAAQLLRLLCYINDLDDDFVSGHNGASGVQLGSQPQPAQQAPANSVPVNKPVDTNNDAKDSISNPGK